jgi:uridine kinase
MLIIGIAGGSGSGKTTITERLVEAFGNQVAVIRHDDYYKAQTEKPMEERVKQNYDCPDAFDTDLMAEHISALRKGESIDCPVYDYMVHDRSDKVRKIDPRPVLIIDGILVLAEPALRDLMDIRLFVDTDADVRLCRRIKRDVHKRGRSLDSVLHQYQETVKPMHEKYVEPSKKYANLVIPEGGKNLVALDMILGRIQQHLDSAQ